MYNEKRCTAAFLKFAMYMVRRGVGGRNTICISEQRHSVHCLSQLIILQTSRKGLRLVMLWGRIREYLHPFLHLIHEVEDHE